MRINVVFVFDLGSEKGEGLKCGLRRKRHQMGKVKAKQPGVSPIWKGI